jgi:hypothetical protein
MHRHPLLPIYEKAGIALGPGFIDTRPHVAAAIIRCITLWSEVDLQFARSLAEMLGATAEPTAAIFLAVPNWQQERVLTAAAEAVFDDKTLALFRAIIKLGKKYADERNDLAHGIFGKSDQILDGVLWIRSKDRISHMIDVSKKSASGDITVSDHHAIRQKIYVYELADLERLAAEMTDYHRLVYDFIPLISQAEGPSRDERYRQLCERPDVQAEINHQNDSRGERP